MCFAQRARNIRILPRNTHLALSEFERTRVPTIVIAVLGTAIQSQLVEADESVIFQKRMLQHRSHQHRYGEQLGRVGKFRETSDQICARVDLTKQSQYMPPESPSPSRQQ